MPSKTKLPIQNLNLTRVYDWIVDEYDLEVQRQKDMGRDADRLFLIRNAVMKQAFVLRKKRLKRLEDSGAVFKPAAAKKGSQP